MAGSTLDGLGDMNGDGLDDLVLEAEFADAAYVVYGKTDSAPIDLLTFDLGAAAGRGFYIEHPPAGFTNRVHVGAIGDANGDGIPDLCLITYRKRVGNAYVIFGARNSSSLDVTELGDRGFHFQGDAFLAVDGAGDMNGDGLDDILLGVPEGSRAYILFGKADPATVFVRQDMAPFGMRIGWGAFRTVEHGRFGFSVAGGEDVNGDGVPDFAIGAHTASPRGRRKAGVTYLFYGGGTERIYVGSMSPDQGTRYLGEHAFDISGSVALSPDLDGDGAPDLLIGSDGYRTDQAGKVHVVSGR
jgi:hypothetical protein